MTGARKDHTEEQSSNRRATCQKSVPPNGLPLATSRDTTDEVGETQAKQRCLSKPASEDYLYSPASLHHAHTRRNNTLLLLGAASTPQPSQRPGQHRHHPGRALANVYHVGAALQQTRTPHATAALTNSSHGRSSLEAPCRAEEPRTKQQSARQRTLNNGRARTEDPASAADPRRPVPAEGVKHRAGAIAASPCSTALIRCSTRRLTKRRSGCRRGVG